MKKGVWEKYMRSRKEGRLYDKNGMHIGRRREDV
jgi:hypothetical protein